MIIECVESYTDKENSMEELTWEWFFCLGCFREDFMKNLSFDLGLEGNID